MLQRFLRENWLYLLILALLLILPHLVGWLTGQGPFGMQVGPRFRYVGQSINLMGVMIEIFALAVLVMSYNLMFGFTGVISFGHALFFGLGGYLLGIVLQSNELGITGGLLPADMDPGVYLLIGVLLVMVVTGLISFLLGLATLRLSGIYFAIFTLAVAEMGFIYFGRLALTNGEDGLTVAAMPEWIDPAKNRLFLYYVALMLFVFTFLFIRRLVNSPTGTVFEAIRENEERAQAIGYNTLRFKLLSITVAGMLAGMAGMIHAILNKTANPEMLGVNFTVDALLMTIIGGVGTFTGPVIGAGGLHFLDTTFRDLELTLGETVINVGDSWLLLLGLIFVLVVLIFPRGIVGTVQQWWQKQQRQRQQTQATLADSASRVPTNETL